MWRYNIMLTVILAGLVQTYHIKEMTRKYQRMPGESIRMDCTVAGDDVDKLTTNIFWKKGQDTQVYKELGISQDGVAYEDTVFYSTGRFSVSIDEVEHYDNGEAYSEYNSDPGTEYGESNNYASNYGGDYQKPSVDYRVTLVIIDLQSEDSGFYICEVGGQRLEYVLEVVVPVESVSVRGRTEAHEGRMIRSPGPVTYNWDVHGYLECVVAGGYPKPELRIYALDMHEKNRLDLSSECYTDFNMTFKGRKTGLQKYHYHQRCYSDFFRLDPMYDGGKIVCEGFVQPNVSAQTRTLAVNVKSPPIAVDEFCHPIVGAELGDIGVEIKCRFKAKPMVIDARWVANTTELNAMMQEKEDGFSAEIQSIGVNAYETKLKIENVTSSSFITYVLYVENSLGTLEKAIELREGYVASRSAGVAVSLLLMFTTLCALADQTLSCLL